MPLTRFAGVIFGAGLALASLAEAAQPARPAVDEQYVLGPDSQPQPGVPEGKVLEFTLEDSKTYPGFRRQWWLYIPPGYDGKTPLPVMVFQDGGGYVRRDGQWRVPVVLENLMAKKQLPKMAAIFVNPGDTPLAPGEPPRKRPDGRPASPRNRSVEYDTVSDKYASFLLEEIFPLAAAYRDHRRSRRPRHLRLEQRRHLRVQRGVVPAGPIPQSLHDDRLVHEHPRRQRVPGHGEKSGAEADQGLPAGRRQRSREPVRLLARGQQGDGRGPEGKGLRPHLRVRRRHAQRAARRVDSTVRAAVAVVRLAPLR